MLSQEKIAGCRGYQQFFPSDLSVPSRSKLSLHQCWWCFPKSAHLYNVNDWRMYHIVQPLTFFVRCTLASDWDISECPSVTSSEFVIPEKAGGFHHGVVERKTGSKVMILSLQTRGEMTIFFNFSMQSIWWKVHLLSFGYSSSIPGFQFRAYLRCRTYDHGNPFTYSFRKTMQLFSSFTSALLRSCNSLETSFGLDACICFISASNSCIKLRPQIELCQRRPRN